MKENQVLHEVESGEARVMVLETKKEGYDYPFYDMIVVVGSHSFMVHPKAFYTEKARNYFAVLTKELVK